MPKLKDSFRRFGNRLVDPGPLTDENIRRNREMADTLLQQASSTQPIGHSLQGIAQLVQGLNSQILRKKSERGEAALTQQRAQQLGSALQGLGLNGQQQQAVTGLAPNVQQAVLARGVGQQLFPGPQPEPKDNRPTLQKEFEFAVQSGFEGDIAAFIELKKSSGTTVNVGGESDFKVPTGFMRDPADPNRVVPIPGGPKDSLTPEAAAKVQLVETALQSSKSFREYIIETDDDGNESVNRINVATLYSDLPFSMGREANVFLRDAIEAKLRAESGAAVPETEVTRASKRFRPHPFDADSTIKIKTDLLTAFLEGAFNKMQRDGRFIDVEATVNAMNEAADQAIQGISDGGIDPLKIDGLDQFSPEQQKLILEQARKESLGLN